MDKEKTTPQTPKNEGNQQQKSPVKTSIWKRYASQKWFFPAIYLGAAALILALIVWFQASRTDDFTIDGNDLLPDVVEANNPVDEDAVPVTTNHDTLAWPVAQGVNATIVMNYYDDAASEEEQAKSLIHFGNEYYPNTGIDLSIDGNTTFDVLAAADGEVIRSEHDPIVGYVVEIKHNNMFTVYQSLQDVTVNVGDKVNQGDVIGKAGRNVFDRELGVHLHFEVRNENSEPTNPLAVLPAQN